MPSIVEARHARRGRGLRELFREVTGQFFGSDLESGYTFIYVWLANQFGHFMIGFAGTIFASWVLSYFFPQALTTGNFLERLGPAAATGALWLLIWVAKELLSDVTGALHSLRFAKAQREAGLRGEPLPPRPARRTFSVAREDLLDLWATLRRYAKNGRARASGVTGATEEDWYRYDIVRDSEIDGWFYLAGVLTALFMYAAPGLNPKAGWPWLIPIGTFFLLLVLSVQRSRDWLWEKVAFDKALLPFVGRFVLNSRPYDQGARDLALDFAMVAGRPGHLVIIGPPKSGRTTTAVALGVEAILRSERDIVVYTTFCKLLDRVAEERRPQPGALDLQGAPGDRPTWPPENAELLIIDDTGAEGAGGRAFITADQFRRELQENDLLREKCRGKRVIWVVGDDPGHGSDWVDSLRSAFGGDAAVAVIAPGETIHWAERWKGRRHAA
jgi:hypothetical protein